MHRTFKKRGTDKDLINWYFSGESNHFSAISSVDGGRLLSSEQFSDFKKFIPELKESVIQKKIPLKNMGVLGYSTKTLQEIPPGYERATITVAGVLRSEKIKLLEELQVGFNDQFSYSTKDNRHKIISDAGEILLSSSIGQDCKIDDKENFVAVYLYRKPKAESKNGFQVNHFSLKDKINFSHEWSFKSEGPEVLSRSGLIHLINRTNEAFALFVAEDDKNSYAYFVDLEDGQLIGKIPFEGTFHFSYPVVTPYGIFLATQNKGLIQLK